MKKLLLLFTLFLSLCNLQAENGYDLWLRYIKINDPGLLTTYKKLVSTPSLSGTSPTLLSAKEELQKGLSGLLGYSIQVNNTINSKSTLVIGVAGDLALKLSPTDEKN